MYFRPKIIFLGWLMTIIIYCWGASLSFGENAAYVTLPAIHITTTEEDEPLIDNMLDRHATDSQQVATTRLGTPDTASLLRQQPGFSDAGGGALASHPVINGMGGARVVTNVDGMRVSPTGPNGMNPILSFVDSGSVEQASVIAGISPVSMGGDSLGSVVDVRRADPVFAEKGKIRSEGKFYGNYRSNGAQYAAGASASVATHHLSLRYNASYDQGGDYDGGGSLGPVRSTSYVRYTHNVELGVRKKNHLFTFNFGQQDMPREGFANQYMDMANSRSTFVNGKYHGDYDWGNIEAIGYWQRLFHAMNMLADKGGHSPTLGMPMNNNERLAGYNVKAIMPLTDHTIFRTGSSFDHEGVNDYWPHMGGSRMMGPLTFHSVNQGSRNRLGHFAEWEQHWTRKLSTLIGVRNDFIMMDTGDVSPYSWSGMMHMANARAAQRFNQQNHHRDYANFDATALMHYEIDKSLDFEIGYARKSRAPGIYESYSWAPSQMTSLMMGEFGDGNGYIGNLNLKSEVGHTASFSFNWHDPSSTPTWHLFIQPFFTYVQNYINVDRVRSYNSQIQLLKFANHNAQLYGINASAHHTLFDNKEWGKAVLSGTLNWVRGQDRTVRSGLYELMPLNGILAIDEMKGPWNGHIEMDFAKAKNSVDWLRCEPRTPGYALLNLSGRYRWKNFNLSAGVNNVLNQAYYLPLGGIETYQLKHFGKRVPVPGMGRSFNVMFSGNF